ncbi:MAG: hypothetical protein ACREMV_11045 [Gemmatimonadales bacterium]
MPETVGGAPRGGTTLGLGLALLGGIVGFGDFGTLPTVLVALSGSTLGFTHPHRAWRWGVFVIGCFGVAQLLLRVLQVTREAPDPSPMNGNVAALAAFVGVYAGVLLRHVAIVLERDG